MADGRKRGVSRRGFLRATGAIAAAGAVGAVGGCNGPGWNGSGFKGPFGVELEMDKSDSVVASAPAQWALAKLRAAMAARGIVEGGGVPGIATDGKLKIVIAGGASAAARRVLDAARAKLHGTPESLGFVPLNIGGVRTLLVAGADGNGLAYALAELADRLNHVSDPYAALTLDKAIIEQPANKVRSICRVFVSEEEDKPWFYDQEGWKKYFDMLATNRFNKFNLSTGLAYDFSDRVVDGYFYFAYPFFMRVPGYDVRAVDRAGKPLPDAEQDVNLKTLQFISKEAAARGIHFQLGLWTHSIKWPLTAGVTANYTLTGITPATQATYSRDALHALIEACPDVKGVTIRTHGESGIPEGDISLWKTVFDGTKNLAGSRKVQIDLHAKGITFEIIDAARATGNPVIVTPKYWAEHNGLPYIQASIREWELPKANTGGLMSLSTGTRNHMRYGYGDIIVKDRQFGIVHRVFPGTQRFLLWGDPVFAREYAKVFSFNGTDGVEWFEPLAFKGRQGTGMAKNRGCYGNASLRPSWPDQMDKYEYTFRLWGRTAYNPDTHADVWERKLRTDYGEQAARVEKALGAASRILPLVTVAHSPSAAQANFWPELYTNMSHHNATAPTYGDDTPSPKVFNTVSSLDPQVFATVNESADALLAGKGLGKISVAEVAAQLDKWSNTCLSELAAYDEVRQPSPLLRASTDAALAAIMGRFWASKFRTGLFYAIFDKSGHEPARQAALVAYGQARDAMSDAAKVADGIYIADISFGSDRKIRGSWSDRLAHIDTDIAGMKAATPRERTVNEPAAAAALTKALARMTRPPFKASHTPARSFKAGAALAIQMPLSAHQSAEAAARLWYRHINQAETYKFLDMNRRGNTFEAVIPVEYTKSPYGMQYYFELSFGAAQSALYPGFREDFIGTPYFVVPQA